MTIARGTRKWIDNFDRPFAATTTPEGGTGWTIKDTSSSGTPTYLANGEDGGAFKITLASTSEEEVVTLFHSDLLSYDLAKLQSLWWVAKVAGFNSVTDLVIGAGAAQNDTEDSVVTNAWFKIDGSVSTSSLVVETDDAATDNDDVATATALGSVYKKLLLDFSQGLSDVRFFVDGARVAAGTTFDMSGLASGLNVQPYVQLHKASGTGVGSVTLAQFGVQYKYAYGA